MRTVLLGSDFIYDKDGNLKPLEINTNLGWDSARIEWSTENIVDYSGLDAFITQNQINEVIFIGSIYELDQSFKQHFSGTSINYIWIQTESRAITVPFVEDGENKLIIRSAYDTTALVDEEYCANNVNFLNLISGQTFGNEIAYKNDGGELINNITYVGDNGDHPNFILKSIGAEYNRSIYPKLYKFSNTTEVNAFLETLPNGFFLMHYYFNDSKLYQNHVRIIRSLNILFPPNLESIHFGAYSKITNLGLDLPNSYDATTKELSPELNEKYITKYSNWSAPKLADGDMVQLADGTFVTVEDLQVGDLLKTIDIPNSNVLNNKKETINYQIDLNEFISGSTYVSNAVTNKKRVNKITNVVKLNFTDGSDWYDTEYSPYLIYKNNEVRFQNINKLEPGDIVLLIDTSQIEISVVQKIIETVEWERKIFNGWTITVAEEHLFLTKTTQSGQYIQFAAIEHNVGESCNCSPCAFPCKDCPWASPPAVLCWYGQCFYVGQIPC